MLTDWTQDGKVYVDWSFSFSSENIIQKGHLREINTDVYFICKFCPKKAALIFPATLLRTLYSV